jgi:fructose-bisphosphate aldolase class II
MFDGSRLALAENTAQTAALVEAAHAAGVGVEAELGQVGSGGDYESFGALRLGFTDPAQVERFAADTGVDYLAVAVGTAHGVYHGEPHLDIALVSEIRRRTEVPLVLHGGTGLSEEQVRSAIRAGIAKVNIATDLYLTVGARLGEEHRRRELGYGEAGRLAVEAFRERAAHYLRLFGSAGKG